MNKGKGTIGTCGFCGEGGGYLGGQGDESSRILHAAVRTGEAGQWEYHMHPNAFDGQQIQWCGMCVRGLIHKFQRYDDTNLRAVYLSYKLRLELDALRWINWEVTEEERPITKQYADDPAIHMEKLNISDEIPILFAEMRRRMGIDITEPAGHSGWHE